MSGECYFCRGLVFPADSGHFLLDRHGDHRVYLHERCAVGQGVIEKPAGPADGIDIVCPECGTVETH
jgi:hypothetical protein